MKDILRGAAKVIVPPLVHLLMRIIWWTSSKKFHFISPVSDAQHVCVCWHGELLMSPQAYRKIHRKQPASAIISSHFDGSLIADIAASWYQAFERFYKKRCKAGASPGI